MTEAFVTEAALTKARFWKDSISRFVKRSFLQRFVSKSHALIKMCFDGGVLWRGMRPLAAKMH